MAKILWLSDGGCVSGFGRVTHAIGERLIRDYGHEVHCLAVNHRGDAWPGTLDPSKPTPIHLYMPTQLDRTDTYGRTRFLEMLGKVEPDVVVIINDPAVLLWMLFDNPRWDPERRLATTAPILSYVPCDAIGLPPLWPGLVPKVTRMLAMSDFGAAQYPGSTRVYHGVDPSEFWQITRDRPAMTSTGIKVASKRDAKKAYGFDPDGFLVGRVDANSQRKDWAATWKALVPFMVRHPEVQVHFHGNSKPGDLFGVDMESLMGRYTEIDKPRVFFPGLHNTFTGWTQQDMNVLVNAFDVRISTSHGEGFGLGDLESIACGVPVIAQNVSATPEVVGPGGILLEPAGIITVPAGSDQWLPDIPAFTDALERIYRSKGLRRDLGQAGVEHSLGFTWDETARVFNENIVELAAARIAA